MPIYLLDENLWFPPVKGADEYGIVAVGGDLRPERLLLAYQSGIFPWYSEGEPIVWHSPDPRFVLFTDKLRVAKSMRPLLNGNRMRVSFDQSFRLVITACQKTLRHGQAGTWITEEMLEAYCHLHTLGYAHSVEVWQEERLVGGLYGVSLGKVFFGESMFAHVSNASKLGFITLVQKLRDKGFQLIDCQVYTNHLESLGATRLSRKKFMALLEAELIAGDTLKGNWQELLHQDW